MTSPAEDFLRHWAITYCLSIALQTEGSRPQLTIKVVPAMIVLPVRSKIKGFSLVVTLTGGA